MQGDQVGDDLEEQNEPEVTNDVDKAREEDQESDGWETDLEIEGKAGQCPQSTISGLLILTVVFGGILDLTHNACLL